VSSAQHPHLSLQRSEAQARKGLLEVVSYDVSLDLSSSETEFASRTEIRFRSGVGETFLDLKPRSLQAVRLDGQPLSPESLDRGRLPLSLGAGEHLLEVQATMPFRNDGEGLHRSVDPADGQHYIYGMSFLDAAPTVFACFDQPDLKAPYTFHVRAPRTWTVRANAAGAEVEPGLWEFETSQPLSTYFVTLVAGPWHTVGDEHDGIPLLVAARASKARELDAQVEEILSITKASFDELHRLFEIRYPFGKYDQMFVPEFNAGAMENPGCVTFRDPLIFSSRPTRGALIARATTIAHEMAHQWFGNIVTPAWWDDLWLNESFAEYLGNRVTADATAYDDAWADLSYGRRQWGLVADQRPSTHPVAGNGAVDAVAALQDFDGISYSKGSAILRQLAATMGDEVFFAGVREHIESHRFANATMADLLGSWERAGAGDLSGFAAQWLRTAGPDTIRLDRAAGELIRTPPAAHPADRSHAFRIAVSDGSGRWYTRDAQVTSERTRVTDLAGEAVVLDPYDDTWAVMIPDQRTITALKTQLPAITDEPLRAGVWNNLRSGYLNAAVSPHDIIDIAEASLPVEDTEDTARRTMAWLFRDVVPMARADAGARLHAAALAKITSTPEGSEQQLAALRAAIRSADDADQLRSWLQAVPSGLELDLDLRWRILDRLATLAAIDRDELREEFEKAPVNEARVALTRSLCSLPDEEAKAYAWSIFTGETDLPNYEVTAAGVGLWRGPDDLIAPYVERYFAEVPGTVGVRSGWVLASAAEAFFPGGSVSEETLTWARQVIDRPDLDLSLRRVVVDGADQLARQLAVREKWPA
jgi:aminopeptidase N